jgi:ABC-type sulfate transport system permease component
MFLKRGHSFLIALLFFLFGSIASYVACQYQFLDIKTETNIIELLLSVGTIVIGVYIAVVLERNRNRSQNFYQYVERKYDALWETFIQFSSVLELSANVELNETSKWFSLIDQKLSPPYKGG